MKKRIHVAGLLALVMALSMIGCGGSGAAEGETVAVQSVSMLAGLGTVGLQNKYAGTVVAQATHEIMKDDDRTIDEVKVAVGDEVMAGDVLFTYDVEEIQRSVEQSELEIEKMKNSIDSTRKQIENLTKEKKKAPSSEQLSYSIEIQTLEADIKETEYNVKTKQAELERLKNTRNNTQVKAEVDGIVQSINEDGGSGGSGSDGIYYGNESTQTKGFITLIETGTYRVKGMVNEMNMGDLGAMMGMPILVRSRVDAEQTWNGTMGEIDTQNPQGSSSSFYDYGNNDESTQSSRYPFYVELESSEGLLMGQHVYIELNVGQDEKQEGIWISSAYIDMTTDKPFVWAANGKDKLEKRKVELGDHNAEMDTWQILEGLAPEDYIAIPSEELKEGLPVTRYDESYFEQGGDFGGGEAGDFGGDVGYEEGGAGEEYAVDGEYADVEYEDAEYADAEAGAEPAADDAFAVDGDAVEEAIPAGQEAP